MSFTALIIFYYCLLTAELGMMFVSSMVQEWLWILNYHHMWNKKLCYRCTFAFGSLRVYENDMPLQPLDPAIPSVPQAQFFHLAHSLLKSTMTLLWRKKKKKTSVSPQKALFLHSSLEYWLGHLGRAVYGMAHRMRGGKKGWFCQKKAASSFNECYRNHQCKTLMKEIATVLPQKVRMKAILTEHHSWVFTRVNRFEQA